MRVIITLLIVSLSGIQGLTPLIFASDQNPPVVRHTPPASFYPQTDIKIEAIVEHAHPIAEVHLWYRKQGAARFQKQTLSLTHGGTYAGKLEGEDNHIEYYIEAVSSSGFRGTDGSRGKPYFLEALQAPAAVFPALNTMKTREHSKKPFWKKAWFWVAVAAVVGGGIAVASGGGDGQNTGTVIVD